MLSIIDYGYFDPALTPDHPFENVPGYPWRYWAPIKRPLSIKNTYPSQKRINFCRNKTQSRICTFWSSTPGFSKVLVADANWSATRHPSGSMSAKENANSLRPLVRETDPRKTLVPCHGQWIVTRYRAPTGPAIVGSWQGQIRQKAHPPGFKFKGVQRRANQDKG